MVPTDWCLSVSGLREMATSSCAISVTRGHRCESEGVHYKASHSVHVLRILPRKCISVSVLVQYLERIYTPVTMGPLTTLSEVLLTSWIFIPCWLLVRDHVRQRGPIKVARKLMFYHNIFQVLLSIFIVITILISILSQFTSPELLPPILAAVQRHDSFLPRYTYHLSKTYEYLDIILFVLNGGHTGKGDVDLHFVLHHLTTPYLGFFRFLNHYEGWRVFALLNATHHAFMYAFFGGAKQLHVVLQYTRYIQLVVGMACDVWVAKEKTKMGVEIWPNVFSAGLLTMYLVLLAREIAIRRAAKEMEKAKGQ